MTKVQSVADIGVLSTEAVNGFANRDCHGDIGQTGFYWKGNTFTIYLIWKAIFSKYRLLILPDDIRLDDALAGRLAEFLAKGGKVLATGESGLKADADAFALTLRRGNSSGKTNTGQLLYSAV